MALRRQSCAFFPMKTLEVVETVIEGADEVRRRAACLATRRRSIVDDDHALSFSGEQIRRCETGDPGTNNAHVRMCIRRKRRLLS
jgi:hypothetical protein